ncbi:MAG: transcription antitermination factor NusB [Candidatus Omnitrophica bacterium]|nr:transcription antitermination factor NusB [Candidatus Omnitrophota bacterium]
MRKRTRGRELALKILYQAEIIRREIGLMTDTFWSELTRVDPTVKDFATKLTLGVKNNLTLIDEKISFYATNWQLKRMAIIDRNILRLGTFELIFLPEIPPKVSINEYVELAKKFGDIDSSKFVNGILDKIHKIEIVSKND